MHRHLSSDGWVRLLRTEKCHECYGGRKPFLDTFIGTLPLEVREMIYEEVLTIEATAVKGGLSVMMTKTPMVPRRGRNRGRPSPSRLALLQTCRQIFVESFPFFYAKNTLRFQNPRLFYEFLERVGPTRLRRIKSLYLQNLVIEIPFYTKSELDEYCTAAGHSERVRRIMENMRSHMIDPDMTHAARLMSSCTALRNIYLDIHPEGGFFYLLFFGSKCGYKDTGFRFDEGGTRWTAYEYRGDRPWLSEFMKIPFQEQRRLLNPAGLADDAVRRIHLEIPLGLQREAYDLAEDLEDLALG